MLLDEIIDNHSGEARVVGEQHDVAQIKVSEVDIVNGIRAIAGIWDAAEMGITQAEAARRIAAADTAEARERVIVELRARALRRAGLDATTGRVSMMAAGTLPWHGLGVLVDKAATSEQAIVLGGLDWSVSKRNLFFDANGTQTASKVAFAIVRDDTHAELGAVGKKYQPIQNKDAFAFLDGIMDEYGARYETVGAVHDGKAIWLLAHLPQQSFTLNGVDRQESYALFTNPHDGSGSAFCYPTSVRVVCANTLRISMHDKHKGISIRHTGHISGKIANAQRALSLTVSRMDRYKEAAEEMCKHRIDAKVYANGVLDAILDISEAEANLGADVLAATMAVTQANLDLVVKRFEHKIEHRRDILEDILDRYESERCAIGGIRGTVWSALQAVTDHADHYTGGRQVRANEHERASRRFASAISGAADEMKQVAYEQATVAIGGVA